MQRCSAALALVLLAACPAAGQSGDTAPPFDADLLSAGTFEYRQVMMMLGQSVEMSSTRHIEAGTLAGEAVWIVAEETRTQQGPATDSTYVQRESLLPLRRVVLQGDQRLVLRFGPGRVSGEYTGASSVPVDIAVDGAVLTGGALTVAIRTLPLEEGYSITLTTLDLQEQTTRDLELAVAGTETVTVPAGRFETYRVTLTPRDEGPTSTLWIERSAPHRVVRTESALSLGAAGTVTAELVR